MAGEDSGVGDLSFSLSRYSGLILGTGSDGMSPDPDPDPIDLPLLLPIMAALRLLRRCLKVDCSLPCFNCLSDKLSDEIGLLVDNDFLDELGLRRDGKPIPSILFLCEGVAVAEVVELVVPFVAEDTELCAICVCEIGGTGGGVSSERE